MMNPPLQKLILTCTIVGLSAISAFVPLSTSRAQNILDCRAVATNYLYIESRNYVWINNSAQVIFKTGNLEERLAIGTEYNEFEMYDVTTGKVTIFKDMAALSVAIHHKLPVIPDMAIEPEASLLVFLSPNQQRVIFPKNGNFWYKNFATGVESDLGINYASPSSSPDNSLSPLYDTLRVFWDDNGETAILEWYHTIVGSNTTVWRIDESGVKTQTRLLGELSPWKEMIQNGLISGFALDGFSSDGRYTLVEPVPNNDIELVYDVQTQTVIRLPFALGGPDIAWLNNHTFIAANLPDVIIYDISTQKKTTLLSQNVVYGHIVDYFMLSPDGRYGILPPQVASNGTSVIKVCKIPWPPQYNATPTPTESSGSVPGGNQING